MLLWVTHLATLALAQTVTVTAPVSIPSNEPQWKNDKIFKEEIMNSTNTYRADHNATDLSWNKTLATFAANFLGKSCTFEHSGGPYGENLAIGYPNVTVSVEAWGEERKEYDFNDGGFAMGTGHFTQLVWKDTTDVGCGRRLCGENGWFLACEYWPVGNVEGRYEDAVEEGGGLGIRPKVWIVFGCALGVLGLV